MKVSKDMMITDILQADNELAEILMASGMHCLGCIMAHGETLEQACQVHGINADDLEAKLNEFLATKA